MSLEEKLQAFEEKLTQEGTDSLLELMRDEITKTLMNAAMVLTEHERLVHMRQGSLLPELVNIAEESVNNFRKWIK